MHHVHAAWAQHKQLLRESEALRASQEAEGSHRAADTSLSAAPASLASLLTLSWWFGPGLSWAAARALLNELRFPRTALLAAVVVGAACVLNVCIARARGEVLDALADALLAPPPGGGGDAGAVAPARSLASAWAALWGWTAGLAALKRLVALSLLEWGCLVAKDVLLGLARAARTGASRSLYLAALLRQDLAFLSAHSSAALAARLETDPETLDELLVHGPERLVQGAVALGTLAWLLSVDPPLLLLSLALRLPQVLQLTEASVRIAAAYERLAAARLQAATARAGDALTHARVVQAHGAEAGEVAGFCDALERYLDVVRASSLAGALLKRSEGVVLLATEVALAAFGALRILQGGTSVGQFVARRDAVGTVIENFHGLEHVYIMLRRAHLLSGRFLALRDREPAVPLPLPLPRPLPAALDAALLPLHVAAQLRKGDAGVGGGGGGAAAADGGGGSGGDARGSSGALPGLRRRRGRTGGGDEEAPATPPPPSPPAKPPFFAAPPSVEFRDVTFSYREGGTQVLRGVSLTIPGGSFAAFVGRSGSGKSTCARLLQRFADPTSGRVLIGGVDVRELPLPQLRGGAVAGMDQESALLQRSIAENIALGWEAPAPPTPPAAAGGAPHPAVLAAAEEAQAAGFIAARPGGFSSAAGERGGALSGGERQRVALARLLLRAPQLAVVDEGTSALDAVSEAAVLRALMGADGAPRRARTTILIAHRLATVAQADLVFVFREGEVVEWGAPAVLAEKPGGAFAELLAASRCEKTPQ